MTQRRHLLRAFAAVTLAAVSLCAAAQDGAVVKSARILEALTSKDVVLDASPARPGVPRRPRPGAVDLQVQFAFNSAELLPIGRQQLDELAHALADRALQADGFELTGHTDRVGDADYNMRLSLERATMVRNYLVTAHGITPQRLMTAGLGFSRLADPANPTAAVNRRVEVRRLVMVQAPQTPQISVPAQPMPAMPAGGGRIVPTPQ
ncbi:MAG: OmpA family protein [Pseudomonadota bacterium]